MSENLKNSEIEGTPELAVGVPPLRNLSATALARRKMLLTSLGKGSAVVAAASVPMHSLAAIGTLSVTASGQRCSISGTMSAVHSNQGSLPPCTGRSPNFYKFVSNWPNYSGSTNPTAMNVVTGGTFGFSSNTKFKDNGLFGSGPAVSLIDILNGVGSDPDAIHWVTALLNGTSGSTAANFPYTAQQVIDFYNNPARRADALHFFITYMETV